MNAPNTAGWRPEMGEGHIARDETFTGNRALMLEERLIFEIGDTSTTGVDIDPAPAAPSRLGGLTRSDAIGLPGLSEPERCGTTPASAARTTASIWASSRSVRAR